jgi:hypothetical protein
MSPGYEAHFVRLQGPKNRQKQCFFEKTLTKILEKHNPRKRVQLLIETVQLIQNGK